MKVRLLSLLSVVLVLSIKAYETTAREANEQNRLDIYQPDISFLEGEQFNPISTVDSLVRLLSESNTVKERHVGFAGITPEEYGMFEILKEVGTQEELNGLLTHYSPVVRVYAYRALLANEMQISIEYEETMFKDTSSVDWFSGCILMTSSVKELVSQGFID
ncbi:MAG: hypothetical protein ACI837_001084 [Crocinitomicaceae bacterium]|jgi:hypothetical protein